MPLVNARLARAYTTDIRASIQEAGAFFLPRAKSMAAETVGVVGLRRHFQLFTSGRPTALAKDSRCLYDHGFHNYNRRSNFGFFLAGYVGHWGEDRRVLCCALYHEQEGHDYIAFANAW